MDIQWNEFQGREVGSWRLETFLGLRAEKAFYTASDAAGERSFLVELTHERGQGFLESIKRARNLSHPHLMSVYDCGQAEVEDTSLEYAVLDLPDDDVAEMLARGASGAAPLDSISSAAANALAYLHDKGLCHGAMSPANIYIVGKEAKLSVDSIREADQRCREEEKKRLQSIFPKEVDTRKDAPEPKVANRRHRFAYLGAALVAIAVFVALLLSGVHRNAQPPEAPQQAADRIIPTTPAVPPAPAPAPAPTPVPARSTVPEAVRPKPAGPWAVIAATYNSYGPAEQRAAEMQKKWPQWPIHVSPPRGRGKVYFVVLKSGLTQEAAERLRRTAQSTGAPPDTYVTKLDES